MDNVCNRCLFSISSKFSLLALSLRQQRALTLSQSRYTNTIFNQSARVLSWDCFLKLFLLKFCFAAFVLCIGFVIIKLKIEGQTMYRKPDAAS